MYKTFHSGLSDYCHKQPNCQGSVFTAVSAKECCVETNESMSYSVGGTCIVTQCVGKEI